MPLFDESKAYAPQEEKFVSYMKFFSSHDRVLISHSLMMEGKKN